jgi:hypothetical protein
MVSELSATETGGFPVNQQTNKPTNQQTNKPTNQQTNKPILTEDYDE